MLPLNEVKVLDLSQIMAGPYCTMVLSDMGAEVTKIESFPDGDNSRGMGPYVNGESYCFAMINRNKKSVALNLKSETGLEIFRKLVCESDVIVENFRPGVTKKLGIDYDSVKELNSGIIYTSISGFGQTGPYRNRGGLDIIAQGVSGLMSMTGEPNGRPAKVGIAINDIAAGATALYSILGAYIHKLKTGEGQYIDTSLVDAGLAWTIWESAAYFGSSEIPIQMGTRHRRSAPYQAYKTKDGYVTVGTASPRLWDRFCNHVVQRPDWLNDPLYQDKQTRLKNADELEQDIEEIFVQETTAYWVEKLDHAGVPGGSVYTYDQTLSDPHIIEREMVVEMEHPILGNIKSLGIPTKFSKTPLSIRNPAPWLGQHSAEKLQEIGLSEEEINQLFEEKIIFNKYPSEIKTN
jgi:crotonobetainyl-CoA:carnitine CoA-transferase CaiB-like acyl-CoA transferase